jgi:hypothetical protein
MIPNLSMAQPAPRDPCVGCAVPPSFARAASGCYTECMSEAQAFIVVVGLLGLTAFMSRKYLSPGTRVALSGAAFLSDLGDYVSE